MGISVGGDIIDVRERRWVMLSRVLSHILIDGQRNGRVLSIFIITLRIMMLYLITWYNVICV